MDRTFSGGEKKIILWHHGVDIVIFLSPAAVSATSSSRIWVFRSTVNAKHLKKEKHPSWHLNRVGPRPQMGN